MMDAIKIEYANLGEWLTANWDKAGTAEFRRKSLVHMTIGNLIRDGYAPEQRRAVAQSLQQIADGTHPLFEA